MSDVILPPGWKTEPPPITLPWGTAIWIHGPYQGVERSAWLVQETGMVMLHGGNRKDDVHVSQFCLDAVREHEEKRVAVASQRELF